MPFHEFEVTSVVPASPERVWERVSTMEGVIPVDYDDVTLLRVEPGRGFLEASPLFTQRRWIHQRTLEAVGGGCRVTDRVRFEPRLPVGGRVLVALYRFVFRHRHRRLGRYFTAEE